MKLIQKTIAYFKDEMKDAEKYIHVATECKNAGELKMYNTALELAGVELQHAMKWHDIVVELIERANTELKNKNIEVPEYMRYVWDEDHKWYIDKISQLKYEIDLLKM